MRARDLVWILTAKAAALGLLWLLFFSGAHQPRLDPTAAARQLGVGIAAPSGPLR
jgi:hypothetical protein